MLESVSENCLRIVCMTETPIPMLAFHFEISMQWELSASGPQVNIWLFSWINFIKFTWTVCIVAVSDEDASVMIRLSIEWVKVTLHQQQSRFPLQCLLSSAIQSSLGFFSLQNHLARVVPIRPRSVGLF
jgi:hypothetical protein